MSLCLIFTHKVEIKDENDQNDTKQVFFCLLLHALFSNIAADAPILVYCSFFWQSALLKLRVLS